MALTYEEALRVCDNTPKYLKEIYDNNEQVFKTGSDIERLIEFRQLVYDALTLSDGQYPSINPNLLGDCGVDTQHNSIVIEYADKVYEVKVTQRDYLYDI